MKKRIYKINNKNLVTGNPNEVTENELLVKENNDGTVELSHRNNGTLETLGSGGNGGGNEFVEIEEIFNFEPSSTQITVGEMILDLTSDQSDIIKNNKNIIITFSPDRRCTLYKGMSIEYQGAYSCFFAGLIEMEGKNTELPCICNFGQSNDINKLRIHIQNI